MADKVVIEAEVKSNIGDVTKDTKNAAAEFKVMGVSLNSVKAGFVSAGTSAKAMFGSIKAGLISTGIGAFVVLIGSLVSYFTNTKRGADKLSQAFTAMGATVDVLTDRFSRMGEIITLVFSGKFKEAGEVAKGIFSGITDEIGKEVKAMVDLKKRTQELRDADNEFMIQKAATRQEIEKARLIAEDETKSAKERLDNLTKALELEEKTTKRELELARERLAIQEEEMALSENSAEDEARLAQLKVELIATETASIKMRRRVVTEVNALEREILAEEKARAKEKQDIIDQEWDAKIKANDEWNKEQERIRKEQAALDKIAADKEIAEAKRVAKEKIDIAKAEENAKIGLVKTGFGVANALAGENVALSKGVAMAQTVFQTQQAIMAAMGATSVADKLLPYPIRLANAIGAGVMGAAALSKIASTSPTGAGASAGSPVAASSTPAPQMMSGAFDISGGVEPEATKAYVVTDEMTNSQNQLANIRRRATI
jgi:hypothetical protein